MKSIKTLVAAAVLSIATAAVAQTPAPAAPAPAFTVTPYGILTLDLYKNKGLFLPAQDYPTYAVSEAEGAMVASVKQSRFGVNVAVPLENLVGATLTGKLEFDFLGPGATSWNSAPLRLRQAYINAEWALSSGRIFVLAGQTDVLVNGLHPESTSYLANPLFQQAGNLHRRTPQLRLGYVFDSSAVVVRLEGSVGSPADAVTPTNPVDYSAGVRSGVGEYEARLGLTMKPVSDIGGTIGVGYHTNQRAYSAADWTLANGHTEKVTATLIGADLEANLTQYLALRGEWFNGEGIDDGFNGIASAAVVGAAGSRHAVKSDGYWAQAIVKPVPFLWILGGLGQEKVDEATYAPVTATSAERLQNDMIHAGLMLHLNKAWRVGLEWVQTTTKARAATATNLNATSEFTASQYSLSTQLRF